MVEMGCFSLHVAIAHNDTAMTKLLLEADADPDLCVYYFQKHSYVNRKWKSPLGHAAVLGNLEIVRDLVRIVSEQYPGSFNRSVITGPWEWQMSCIQSHGHHNSIASQVAR
jgi:hypothetical protein